MAQFRSDAYRNALANAHIAQRGASAEIHLRDGAAAGTGPTGVLLGQLTGNATAWAPSATAGVLTSNAITSDTSADATGTAASYVLQTSAGLFLESGGLVSDGVTITNTSIAAGQLIQMTAPWVNTSAYDDGV